ncbi:MAG TPA: DUF1724 domain-containing protein [Methanolinea sp.]|jgi:predicted transcriptional regulator|nr:MAG: hypothetical protein A4E41_02087 [Methanoregulaceae archaeon PtaU1.Bin066]HNQ29279.1 DUF1724 domain-containing protein [Methanolinea sp.]
MDILEIYHQHSRLIHSIYNSRLKIQVLLALLEGKASLSTLRSITGSTSPALIPKIRNLEALALVEAEGYEYRLSTLGKVVAEEVKSYVTLMGGIASHQQFWVTHDLSGLPPRFLARIGELQVSHIQTDTTVDMFSVYTHYLAILKEAAYIHGISSVASPGLAQFLSEKVDEGVPVELVVSHEVIDILKQEPYASHMKALASSDNFHVWVTKEILKVGLTVTDRNLSLGLFKKESPLYDSSSDLFSSDPAAVGWGEDLFQHYRKRSTELDISAFF